ncbi:MAG: hypothetical protein GY862_01695, partial [Gammaproteobacteria bacterium]|nr:hypothetical protein [Gammaproteobacteria bacterium]
TLLNFIPPQWLVLMLGFACVLALALLRQVHAKLSPVRTACAASKRKKNPLDELNAALYYIVHSKLMIYMTIGLVLFVVTSKMLEYQYQAIIYPEIFPEPTQRAKFFATYEIFANLAWLIIQIFVTSRIIVKLGIGASNLLHPVLTTLISLGLLFRFGFFAGFFAQFVNQEMRGALRSPANNLLFNAVPPNMWGATKAFLNGIIFPLATLIASTSLLLMKNNLSHEQLIVALPLITLILSISGVLAALPQWAAYNRGVLGLLHRSLFSRGAQVGKGNSFKQMIEEKLKSDDPQQIVSALEVIRVSEIKQFARQTGKLLHHTRNKEVKQHCIQTLAALPRSEAIMTYLVNGLKAEHNPELLALILETLRQCKLRDEKSLDAVEKLLLHPVPAVFTAACLCLYENPDYAGKIGIQKRLLLRLKRPDLPHFPLYLYALGELRRPAYSGLVTQFFSSRQPDVRLAAFKAHIRMLEGQLDRYKDRFINALESPSKEIKFAALRALQECSPPNVWKPVIHLLGAKDRTLVHEAKELLRLNLSRCKPSLLLEALDDEIPAGEKFEILSLVYPKLDKRQQGSLRESADRSLRHYIRILGLLKLYLKTERPSAVSPIIEKTLLEIAENYLLTVLTIITFLSDETHEFFLRVNRGLQSSNRANQGNAMEVLSNAGEKHLVARVFKFFDEQPKDLQSLKNIHQTIFATPLELDEHNYKHMLFALDNDLINASLYYAEQQQTGKLNLEHEKQATRELLGMT